MRRKVLVTIAAITALILLTVASMGALVLLALGGWKQIKADQNACATQVSSVSPNDTLFQAIFDAADGNQELAMSMLVGTNLESGWDPHAVANGAYGAYQVQNPGRYPNPNITVQQALNPTYATTYMLPRYKGALPLVSASLWQNNPALAAEEVAYHAEKPTQHYYQAQGWPKVNAAFSASQDVLQRHGAEGGTDVYIQTTADTSCEQDPTQTAISAALQACLSKVGDAYPWGPPKDGAELVSWCYQQAGLNLPSTIGGLAKFDGDDAQGISVTQFPGSDIASGKAALQPGDILLWAGKHDPPSRSNAAEAGLYVTAAPGGNTLPIATYNVRGSTHTPAHGPQSGPERIKRAAALIMSQHFAVVGTQELQANQRAQLLKSLGNNYGIYPTRAQYGLHQKGINSVNSIIWDKSQVSFVSGGSLPMPYYFNRRPMHIPLVQLQELKSGQQFYVANTHDPAMNFAKLRYLDALQHARDADNITADGTPMIFTGDFNSAYSENARVNPVWRHQRKYMTWCVMTRSGRMLDGYDAAQSPVRTGECPPQTTREKGSRPVDHVYVSNNIHVSKYHYIESRQVTASDHGVVYIDAQLPAAPKAGKSKGSKLGQYIGVDTKSKIGVLPVGSPHLIGALRLTVNPVETSGQSGTWQNPLGNASYVITCGYGYNACGVHSNEFHNGVDMAAPAGTPIYSASTGTVARAEYNGGDWGNYIVISSGDVSPLYAHMTRFAPSIHPGMPVVTGQLIGYVGSTGNATGPHLHYTDCVTAQLSYCLLGSGADGKGSLNPITFMQSNGVNLLR